MKTTDFVEELGVAVLPHHLRRVVDELIEGSAEQLASEGFSTPARGVSMMMLLARERGLPITKIAAQLHLSHPQVIRNVQAVIAAGLAVDEADLRDLRVRVVSLTKAGRREARRLDVRLKALCKVYEDLFEEIGIDLYDAALRARAALRKKSCATRLHEIMNEEAVA